jgi:hypothetical protein
MTFMWIENQGLPRRPYRQQRFERRIDDRTADDIADALRARGIQPAALAMQYLKVDMDVALRVLAGASTWRGLRGMAAVPSAYRKQRQADQEFAVVGAAGELADA